jgi:hypothetical protein
MRNDQTGKVKQMVSDMVRALHDTREMKIFSTLRRSFDTGLTLGTGKPLVSTTIPRKDGGSTYRNTFNDGVQYAMTYNKILELQDILMDMPSNSGNALGIGGTGNNLVLICGRKLREKAFQYAGVEGPDMEPDTNENNMNYIRKGEKFDVLIVPQLEWFYASRNGETAVAKTSSSNYWDTMWGVLDREAVKRSLKVFVQSGYERYDEEKRITY